MNNFFEEQCSVQRKTHVGVTISNLNMLGFERSMRLAFHTTLFFQNNQIQEKEKKNRKVVENHNFCKKNEKEKERMNVQ